MKTRSGFVSNSSSSSFIILLDDSNRHLANYDYVIKNTEYIFNDDPKVEKRLLDNGYKLKIEFFNKRIYKHFIKNTPILKTTGCDLGRDTSICFGEDLLEYINFLRNESTGDEFNEHLNDLATEIQNIIDKYGLENVLFFRDSDEDMGGELPSELKELESSAIWTQEYH